MACASQGTGLGRLFTCPHGLIPARINVHRWSRSNGCTRASGEQNRHPLIASVTLGHFLLTQPKKRSPQRGTRVAVSERLVPPASPFAGAHARLRLSAPPSSGLDAPSGLMLWHLVSLIHMTQLITCLKDTKGCWNSKPGFKFQTYPILYSVDC
jgi:hypothetical protein